MADVVTLGEYEYRMQGGEIHRRPAERDGLLPKDAAWLVLSREDRLPSVPQAVTNYFTQVRNPAAVD